MYSTIDSGTASSARHHDHKATTYKDRLDFINVTEIGESQAMMEMVRHENIGNIQHFQHGYYENVHGPGVLVPTTQFRQQCPSFE